ncbi:TATA-box-binding protein [Halogranum rubrum]|nr:hypothetical protein [Halogranum rubrum]
MLSIANIVASGKFDLELELATLSKDLRALSMVSEVEHSKKNGDRLLIRFSESNTRGILTRTGVYIFTGANSYDDLETAKHHLFNSLRSLGILSDRFPTDSEVLKPLSIQNIVFTAELDTEGPLDLNNVCILLGMEKTEYEPEQFPGLVYRPDGSSCTILIFSSRKVVFTGINTEQVAHDEFEKLQDELLV